MSDNQGIRDTCIKLFRDDRGEPLEITDYQAEIISSIFFKSPKRVVCAATTRAGKSLAVSLAIVLLATFVKGEKIRLIAPTLDHTKIVMGYVIQHTFDSEVCANQLRSDMKGMGAERLKKELTKHKLTLKNGSEIMAITANLSAKGRSLMGWGGSCIIVDEGEQIPLEIMQNNVMRMLGDDSDSNIFIIGNPVAHGYMWEKSTDPNWTFMRVNWQDCVREQRLTKEFVMERKGEMNSMAFQIMYDADWPPELEDQLFIQEDLENISRPLSEEEVELLKTSPDEKRLGCDIARFGMDFTVLQPAWRYGDKWFFPGPKVFEKKDLMGTVGEIVAWHKLEAFDKINIDDSGLGGGVTDRLKEIEDVKTKVFAFIAGESPHKLKRKLTKREEEDNKQFLNKKAWQYRLFEGLARKNLVRVIPNNYSSKLLGELRKMRYEFTSNGKLKVVDPESKSPDFADAACYSLFIGQKFVFGFA